MAPVTLHASQTAALEYVERRARERGELARATLSEICAMSNLPAEALDGVVASIRAHARVVVHFHPDRPGERHATVAENLLACGSY